MKTPLSVVTGQNFPLSLSFGFVCRCRPFWIIFDVIPEVGKAMCSVADSLRLSCDALIAVDDWCRWVVLPWPPHRSLELVSHCYHEAEQKSQHITWEPRPQPEKSAQVSEYDRAQTGDPKPRINIQSNKTRTTQENFASMPKTGKLKRDKIPSYRLSQTVVQEYLESLFGRYDFQLHVSHSGPRSLGYCCADLPRDNSINRIIGSFIYHGSWRL